MQRITAKSTYNSYHFVICKHDQFLITRFSVTPSTCAVRALSPCARNSPRGRHARRFTTASRKHFPSRSFNLSAAETATIFRMYLGWKPRSGVSSWRIAVTRLEGKYSFLVETHRDAASRHPRRCWELSFKFLQDQTAWPGLLGYSVSNPGYRGHVTTRPENLRRLPRVHARTRGLTKIPNKEVSAMPMGAHRFPRSLRPSPLVPVPPTAAARNFRQRDFSNFHCTSQRDFPHANGMRNVRWKRRSDKHTGPGWAVKSPPPRVETFYLPSLYRTGFLFGESPRWFVPEMNS